MKATFTMWQSFVLRNLLLVSKHSTRIELDVTNSRQDYHIPSQVSSVIKSPVIAFILCLFINEWYFLFAEIVNCVKPEYEGLIVSPSKLSYSVGEDVTLECETGYFRQGFPYASCEETGKFHPPISSTICKSNFQRLLENTNWLIHAYKETFI